MMKGLLLKEFYMLKGFALQFVVILAVLVFWSRSIKSTNMFTMMVVMYCCMMVISSMSYDENVQFYKYELTLPISRAELVRSKFLLLLLLSFAGVALGMAGSLVTRALSSGMKTTLFEDVLTVAASWSIFMVTFSILIPLIFKLGAEKGRYCLMAIYIIVFVAIYGVYTLSRNTHGSAAILELTEQAVPRLVGGSVVLALLVYGVCYLASLRVVLRKEW